MDEVGGVDLPKFVERVSEPIEALIDVSVGKASELSNKASYAFVNEKSAMIFVVSSAYQTRQTSWAW
jgi:hypothetical protein